MQKDIDPKNNWPDNQDYIGSCRCCDALHLGPKRRPCCWTCYQSGRHLIPLEQGEPGGQDAWLRRHGIYVASKAVAHSPQWREMRAAGWPIVSRWIDQGGQDDIGNWPELWDMCFEDLSCAAVCLAYKEPGETLKGGLIEIGAALSMGIPVIGIGLGDYTIARSGRIINCGTLEEALQVISQITGYSCNHSEGENMDEKTLLEHAAEIRDKAYAPYSKFQVGAAVRTENGKVFQGVNVENVAYPEGTCAEAGAIAAMIAAGERTIVEVAVIAQSPAPVPPCGGCRQKLAEFAASDAVVTLGTTGGKSLVTTVGDLLPGKFANEHMADA